MKKHRLLTDRKIEIIRLVANGYTNDQIARRLHVSTSTVQTHIRLSLKKMGAKDRANLVGLVYRYGYLTRADITVPDALLEWSRDPHGGDAFLELEAAIRSHDPSCYSLKHVWLPRRGNASPLRDFFECEGCRILFHEEAMYSAFGSCSMKGHYFCDCCQPKTSTCACDTQSL